MCPPPRIATASPLAPANRTAACTSATLAAPTTTAGRRGVSKLNVKHSAS